VSFSRPSIPALRLDKAARVAHQLLLAVNVQHGVRVDDSVANPFVADPQTGLCAGLGLRRCQPDHDKMCGFCGGRVAALLTARKLLSMRRRRWSTTRDSWPWEFRCCSWQRRVQVFCGILLGIKIFSAQSERPVFGRGTFSLKPFL